MTLACKLKIWIVLIFILVQISPDLFSQSNGNGFHLHHKKKDTFDVVIVPGIAYEPQWEDLLKKRVVWGWLLYKNGLTKNLIFSGGAVNTPYYECRIMGLMAEELGVPKEHIFYDSIAEHSVENVLYSMLLARKMEFRKVGLATDPVQAFFLKKFIRKRFRSQIKIIAMNLDSVQAYASAPIKIDPKEAMVKNKKEFVPLVDRQSFFHRRTHTMGRHISKTTYMRIMNPGRKIMPKERRRYLIRYLNKSPD